MRQGNFLRQQQQQQQRMQEQQLKQQQLKRLQQQQQQLAAAGGTAQATVAVPVSLAAGAAKVAVQQARPLSQQQQQQQQQQQVTTAQQQQAQQQQQAVVAAVAAVKAATPLGTTKQQTAITRNLTEAEMAQLLKRRELQQKQQMAAAHLLAQAQLQQQQAQQQQQAGQQTQQVVAVSQQQQQTLAGAVQTPVATLVKTVSAPSALGPSQTAVTIPVSAVTMAGVNINVSLAQQGKVNASKPTTTASVTPQQMQMRQLQIQQQLLQQQQQQRKVTLQTQQKVASLSQAQMPAGKAPTVATQLGTVQIVQQGSAQGAKTTTLPSATAITVQQIIKQVLPVNQNFLMSSAMQAAAGSSSGATTVSPATQVQLHAMLHKPAVSTVALAAPTAVSSGATAATLVPTRIMALQQPPGQPATVALKQGLQPSTSDQHPPKEAEHRPLSPLQTPGAYDCCLFPRDMSSPPTTNILVIAASAGTAQTSTYTVEGSAATPLVASIVADAAALKPVEGGALPKAIAVAVTTAAAAADNSVVPPNVTAPSSSETITRAVSVDVSAATVQAVQAAIEAARQQGSLPYTMRLRNNPPKPA
nr:mediator of RNA polymerase II transcription subunit 15-like [Rhipicephalus microplus]